MKKFFVLLAVVYLAGTSFAVIDPDDDMMGFYFDTEGDVFCVEGVETGDILTMYLILTRPTADAIFGYEAGYDIVGDAMALSFIIYGCRCMPVSFPPNIIVGFGNPLPTDTATILLSLDLMYMDPDLGPVEFYLHGTTPSSIDPAFPTLLLANGVLQSTGISALEGPSAQINGGCQVVGSSHVAFDFFKSLYR